MPEGGKGQKKVECQEVRRPFLEVWKAGLICVVEWPCDLRQENVPKDPMTTSNQSYL